MILTGFPARADLAFGHVVPEGFTQGLWDNITALDSDATGYGASMVAFNQTAHPGLGANIQSAIDNIFTYVSNGVSKNITQTAHGFTIGNWLAVGPSGYYKAQANISANADVVGVVTAVTDANNFALASQGYLTNSGGAVPVYPAGTAIYLSDIAPGGISNISPTNPGTINKPVAIITVSGSEMIIINFRGMENGTDSTTSPNTFTGTFSLDGLGDMINVIVMEFVATKAGYLTDLSVDMIDARIAGTIDLAPTVNGTAVLNTGLDLVINAGNPQQNYRSVSFAADSSFAVAAGDRVGVIVTTTGFTPEVTNGSLAITIKTPNV